MSNEYRRIELMTGDVRRRRWTTEQKLTIIEQSFNPGETVSSTARRHGVAPNLLYRWRRLLSEGGLLPWILTSRLSACGGKDGRFAFEEQHLLSTGSSRRLSRQQAFCIEMEYPVC